MFTAILKVTNGCNLRCKYCSVGEKEDIKSADIEILKKSVDFIANAARYKKEKNVSVILHGGEPTLICADTYRELIDYAQKYDDLKFLWKMQSNGFNISDDLISLLKDKNISLGISLDAGKENHNKYRVDVSGNGTYDRVTENIIKLKENGIMCSCLAVINHNMLNQKLSFINWFEENNIHIKLNPVIECGSAYGQDDTILKEGEYAEYIIRVFKYMLDNDINISIQPIEGIFKSVLGIENNHECTFSSDCHNNFMCIDYNGSIYPCGRFCDMKNYQIGNIFNSNVDLLFNSNSFRALDRLRMKAEENCLQCHYKPLCEGGCMAVRALNKGENPLCEDYKNIMEFFENDGIALYKNYLVNRKQLLLSKLQQMESEN